MKVEPAQKSDAKGKGKAGPRLLGDDAVQNLTKVQMEAEVQELEGLREDLALKVYCLSRTIPPYNPLLIPMAQVEELKTVPNEPAASAPELAAKALDQELNAPASSSATSGPAEVRDLTSMVKKKKKAPIVEPTASASKRKAEDEAPDSPSDKKARVEDSAS